MDTKTRDMVNGWINDYKGDREAVARYMSRTLRLGSLKACRDLVATADRLTELAAQREWVAGQIMGRDVTWGELHDAFERVKPADHWKNPIAAEFTTATEPEASEREVETIRYAVAFFTGSKAEIRHLGNYRFRCEAAGYYVAVGA